MGTINDLYQLIEDENIVLDMTFELPECINGVYMKSPISRPIIAINRHIEHNLILLKITLAEELGHHFTSVGNCSALFNSYIDRTQLNKSEIQALKWSTEYLLPLDILKPAFIKMHNRQIDNIFDELEVPKEFLMARLKFLSRQFDFIDLDEKIKLLLTTFPNVYTVVDFKQ